MAFSFLAISGLLLIFLLLLLIPVGRYARKIGLSPRYWIMLNMVAWAACWLTYKWIWNPLFYTLPPQGQSNWISVSLALGITGGLCSLTYIVIWVVLIKKKGQSFDKRIDEIGKSI